MKFPIVRDKQLCKHDWVGDDDCAYCRAEEVETRLTRHLIKKDEFIAALERKLAEKDAEIERLINGS